MTGYIKARYYYVKRLYGSACFDIIGETVRSVQLQLFFIGILITVLLLVVFSSAYFLPFPSRLDI